MLVILSPLLISMLILANNPVVVPEVKTEVEHVQVSRGAPEQSIERRVMRVTAYTNHDKGMDGRGITTSGEKTIEGRTIAAPDDIPLYSEIYIPTMAKTYIVTDRGGAIRGSRLDLFMESRMDAFEFGVQDLEVLIREEK